MSSLRPEINKLHSLGKEEIRWKNLFVEGIDADGQVKINFSENSALIITGNAEIREGDISIWDNTVNPQEEYKVLERLKNLEANSNNIDTSNLMHLSSSEGNNENILTLKTFKGGLILDTSGSKNYIITPSGSIPSGSNDGTIPTTYWVNQKLSTVTIENATDSIAGKVQLAKQEDINLSNDVSGSNPLVIRPSQLVSYVSSSVNSIAGGLNYKGAIEILESNGTKYISPPISGSSQGDFWYVKTGGTITISDSDVEFNNNDIVIFKDAGIPDFNSSDFDIIPNSLSFQQIKNQLVSGNVSNEKYYANSLFAKGLTLSNFNSGNASTYILPDQIFKNYGGNISLEESSYNLVSSSYVGVPTITFNTPTPTDSSLKSALNVESMKDYLDKYLSLNSLSDVSTSGSNSPTNGQVLTWDTGINPNQWRPKTIQLTTNIDSLTDVTITNVTNGQILLYSSASNQWINSDNNSQIQNAAYVSGTTDQTFLQKNIFSNGLIMSKQFNGSSWTNWPNDIKDQKIGDTTYSNILYNSSNFGQNIVATQEWTSRRSLKRIRNYSNLNSDLNLIDLYVALGYSETLNNYPYFNEILWIFRSTGQGNPLVKTITLPNINNTDSNPPFIKQGFTLEIKNIPVSNWSTNLPENYIINIVPAAGQCIDAETNATIQLVPYASMTFTISDSSEIGWVII